MFNFFKRIISPTETNSSSIGENQKQKADELGIIDLSKLENTLAKEIRISPAFNKLTAELSTPNVDFNAIDTYMDEIKSLIPQEYEITLRIVRWDGRVMAQKGTVISPNILNIMFETGLGEFSLQIVLTPKPSVNEKYRILWLGLDYAGKTSLIHRLRYNEFKPQNRTIGQDIEDFIMEGLRITNVDLGGQKSLRDHWLRFPLKPHVIVYVIDASDTERFPEALAELKEKVLNHEAYKDVPILFLLNKMDLLTSQELEAFVVSELNLPSVMDLRTWHVQKVSAKTGDGLVEAIERLTSLIQSQVTQ